MNAPARAHHEPDLHTPSALAPTLDTLAQLERLYHAAHPEATLEHFDRLVAPGFWEIGASGRNYSRAFARSVLAARDGIPAPERWQDGDHALTPVAPDVFLLAYTLREPGRTTRRTALWQQSAGLWQVLFHQGTVCL